MVIHYLQFGGISITVSGKFLQHLNICNGWGGTSHIRKVIEDTVVTHLSHGTHPPVTHEIRISGTINE